MMQVFTTDDLEEVYTVYKDQNGQFYGIRESGPKFCITALTLPCLADRVKGALDFYEEHF